MRVYRIELINGVVYKTSKRDVHSWFSRNPGEGQCWGVVDVLVELDRLRDELESKDREIDLLRRRLEDMKDSVTGGRPED